MKTKSGSSSLRNEPHCQPRISQVSDGGDIKPSGKNDCVETLVDKNIEDSLEKKKDEVPS